MEFLPSRKKLLLWNWISLKNWIFSSEMKFFFRNTMSSFIMDFSSKMNFLNSKWNYFLQNGISSSEMGFLFLKSRFFLRNGFFFPEMLFLSQKWYFQQKSYNRYVTLYYLESAFWLQYVLIPRICFLVVSRYTTWYMLFGYNTPQNLESTFCLYHDVILPRIYIWNLWFQYVLIPRICFLTTSR